MPSRPTAEAKKLVPILIQNPDGTIAEGVPPGYKEKTPLCSPRIGFTTNGVLWVELEPHAVADELSLLYQRHEKLFICLLLIQSAVEICFFMVYITNREEALAELDTVYGALHHSTIKHMFWGGFVLQFVYSVTYYVFAVSCIMGYRIAKYKGFATWSLIGILGQLLLTYINKFNTLVFFMRLLIYIYGKFVKSLIHNMVLLGGGREPGREPWQGLNQ